MIPSLSVVINTKNAASTLERCLYSLKPVAREIVVMDMHSTDATAEIAEKFGAQFFLHEDTGYVEPARNAAIAKATGEWVLVVDADEALSEGLAERLPGLVKKPDVQAYFLPRKNIIFDQVAHTGWWPDYQLRLFRRGSVVWSPEIHSVPKATGKIAYLPPEEELALIHYNYASIDEYIDRAQRYAGIIANQERRETIPDPLEAFFAELLARYYSWEGYRDGRHGEFLSVLQGCTKVLEAAKIWEQRDFAESKKNPRLSEVLERFALEARWWEAKARVDAATGPAKWWWKIRQALRT